MVVIVVVVTVVVGWDPVPVQVLVVEAVEDVVGSVVEPQIGQGLTIGSRYSAHLSHAKQSVCW